MHTEPRTTEITRIYLHTNEGPQGPGAAEGLNRYLARIDGGYHVIVDDATTVRVAADNLVVWGAGGDNSPSLHLCFIGRASMSLADWNSAYSKAMLERGAQQVASWCRQYGIPVVHLAPGCTPQGRGIVCHADNRCSASEGHTDPGPVFESAILPQFLARVNEILSPPPDPKLVNFLRMIASFVKPIRYKDSGKRVAFVQAQLHRRSPSTPTGKPGHFDAVMVERVAQFKTNTGLKPVDGTICGLPCVKRLLKP